MDLAVEVSIEVLREEWNYLWEEANKIGGDLHPLVSDCRYVLMRLYPPFREELSRCMTLNNNSREFLFKTIKLMKRWYLSKVLDSYEPGINRATEPGDIDFTVGPMKQFLISKSMTGPIEEITETHTDVRNPSLRDSRRLLEEGLLLTKIDLTADIKTIKRSFVQLQKQYQHLIKKKNKGSEKKPSPVGRKAIFKEDFEIFEMFWIRNMSYQEISDYFNEKKIEAKGLTSGTLAGRLRKLTDIVDPFKVSKKYQEQRASFGRSKGGSNRSRL